MIAKPCKKLGYCPYGELVENFPHVGTTRARAVAHNRFVSGQLAKGAYTGKTKRVLEKSVRDFDPKRHPVRIAQGILKKRCSVFGHQCPVFFVAEGAVDDSK